MRVLIVCSKNSGQIAPFIQEQVEALNDFGVKTDYFCVQQKGFRGYLKERKYLLLKINELKPQIIHAHYGLSGLLANLQRDIPVVTTYHGSDINSPRIFPFSRLNMFLSAYNIFVSKKNRDKSRLKCNVEVIPCGVNTELFVPFDKKAARNILQLSEDRKYVLFAGSFDNTVKNAVLAKNAVALLNDVELLELKAYSRQQVVYLMNAVDAVLMTSFTEGSPQFIKEAMACNCPIVSVGVGDVADVISETEGCYIAAYQPVDVADKLQKALDFDGRTQGRKRLLSLNLDNLSIAQEIIKIYSAIVGK